MKIKNILFALTIIILSTVSVVGQTTENSNEQKASFARLYLGLNGALNISMPSNASIGNMSEWSTSNELSIIPSLEISYMVSKSIGIGTGFKLGSYKTSYTIDGYSAQLENQFVDIDGDTYNPVYENVNVTEKNTFQSIDIPLFIKYQMGSGKLHYFANVGIIFSKYSKMNYTLDGTLTRMGYYPQYNVILDGYPEYNYDDISYNANTEEEIEASGTGLYGFASAGLMYQVGTGIFVKAGVSAAYGLSDINPEVPNTFDNFHSSTIIGKTTLNNLAVELGIVYTLMKK